MKSIETGYVTGTSQLGNPADKSRDSSRIRRVRAKLLFKNIDSKKSADVSLRFVPYCLALLNTDYSQSRVVKS